MTQPTDHTGLPDAGITAGTPISEQIADAATPEVQATVVVSEAVSATVPAAPVTGVLQEDPPKADPAEPSDADKDLSVSFTLPPYDGPLNALQDRETYQPLDKKWDYDQITLYLPSDTDTRINELVRNTPNLDIAATEEGNEWMYNIQQGAMHGVRGDFGASATRRTDASWRQAIEVGQTRLGAAQPRIGDTTGPLLKGERAIMRINALLGRGSLVQIPLWHSGFWISLRAPEESQLLAMYQQIAESKIKLGRETHGLAYANHSVFMVEAVVQLAMDMLYETTVKDLTDLNEIRSMIKAPDIGTLAWGLALAVWPRGFQYSRAVLDEVGKEARIIHEKLNLSALQWTDSSSLNEWQKTHMASRAQGSMSRQTVQMYTDHFVRGKPVTEKLNEETLITLKVPSIAEYLNGGELWVNGIVRMIDAAFTKVDNLNERNKLVNDQGKATSMRQYVHWIKELEFPSIEKKIIDADTISKWCDSMSKDDADRDKFFNIVNHFIGECTVSVIATPIVPDLEKDRALPRHPWLLPMDAVSTFFTLLDQKVQQIQARP